jgi:predicted PurR-regulated permease PerM
VTGSQQPHSGAPRAVGWTRARIVFLAIAAALVAALVFLTSAVLLPFVVALIIAFVFTPLVAFCERFRVPRALAILLIYAIFFGGLYLAVAAATPRLYVETRNFIREVPVLAHDLVARYGPRVERWIDTFRRPTKGAAQPARSPNTPALVVTPRSDGSFAVEVGAGVDIVQVGANRWSVQPLPQQAPEDFRVTEVLASGVKQLFTYVGRNASGLVRLGQAVVVSVSRFVFLLFMTLMLAGYLMLTREKIVGFFRSLGPPGSRTNFDRLLWRIDRGLSGVVRGQLLICLVNGLLSALGFWLFDLKYWPIMALIAGVASLIPIFGAILSSIPAVAIGLTQGFWTGLWVLLWILGVHQIEANLLNPKIIGTAARIHPVLVVFSLVVGEHFFGLWGALLAVPTWSLLQSFFNHFRYLALPDQRDSAPPGVL